MNKAWILVFAAFAVQADPHPHGEVADLGISGDIVLDSTSFALAQSLGDVDLGRAAECIVTEQYGFLVWQRQYTKYDVWCLAGILDEQYKPGAAAIMRCSDKKTKKLYGRHCTETLNFGVPVATEPNMTPLPQAVAEEYVKEAAVYRQQQAEETESLEQRIERIEAASRAAGRATQARKARAQYTLEQLQGTDNDSEDD